MGAMSAAERVKELKALPPSKRANVTKRILKSLYPHDKRVERLVRRLENPDIPDDVWRGIEVAEDGKLIDMDEALTVLDRP
jgi:hypothetical protein